MITPPRALLRFVLVASILVVGASCRAGSLSQVKRASVSAGGVRLIRIVSDAGSLSLDGRPGDSVASVRAIARGSSPRVLSRIGLVATRTGDVVTIRPELPHRSWFHWGNSFLAMLDMTITVPAGVPVEISDGSGEIVARGVGPLKISDGAGGIDVRGVTGAVSITDGSGDINVNGVDGDVSIVDGSGGVSVANVTGNLNVPDDGSGTLTAQRIGGSVRVNDKGSGALNVSHVGSDLIVGEKGSGLIRYEDIRGKVAVPHRR